LLLAVNMKLPERFGEISGIILHVGHRQHGGSQVIE